MVQSQPWQIVLRLLSQKIPSGVAQVKALSLNPSTEKKNKTTTKTRLNELVVVKCSEQSLALSWICVKYYNHIEYMLIIQNVRKYYLYLKVIKFDVTVNSSNNYRT
jgi:hypothetical protein